MPDRRPDYGAAHETAEPIITAADLGRELKRWARRAPGGPIKVAALARRLAVSQSSLYAYLAGTTVPASDALDDLLRALDVPPAEQRRITAAREALQRPQRFVGHRLEPAPARQVPRELPAEQAGFTGRASELETLDRLAANADGTAPATIAVISGTAGVGKTALAVRWGNRAAGRFTDGCLYADLRGYSPGEPRDPGDVLAGFLRGLGLDDSEIPDGRTERAARYRSLLAGRRTLILLDNAIDVDQVRSLLPGTSNCFVVITSRADLTGLRVSPGALPIVLHPLPHNEGMDILRSYLGDRIDRSATEAADLAQRCGGLPLALRIVAARAAVRPDLRLRALVDELGSDSLDPFDVGDPETAVRTVFSWSDQHLEPRDAIAFRLLGDHPVRELDVYGAAALLGAEPRTASRRLDALVAAHLVRRSSPGHYGMHDLVRAYSRERAVADLADNDRTAALARLIDYYLDAAAAVMTVLYPDMELGEKGLAATPPVPSAIEARDWIEAEWDDLLAVIAAAANRGWQESVDRAGDVLRRYLDQSGRHGDALVIYGHSLTLSGKSGDQKAEASALDALGVAYMRLGRHREALDHRRRVLELRRETGDRNGEAGALNNFGNLLERLGRYDESMACYQQAVTIARELGLRQGEAILLTNIGFLRTRLGEHRRGIDDCGKAVALFREVGDNGGVARALGNLGEALRLSGQIDEAFEQYDRALTLARDIGALGIETEVLNHLGEAHLASGLTDRSRASHEAALEVARDNGDRYEQARALEGIGRAHAADGAGDLAAAPWRESLDLYRKLGLPEAGRVRAELAGDH